MKLQTLLLVALFDRIGDKWGRLTGYGRMNWLGTLFLCLPVLALFGWPGDSVAFAIAGAPALFCFFSAHVLWWMPKLRRLWATWARNAVIVLTLTVAGPVSVGIARRIAISSTGLPPSAVDLTVWALSLLTYPVLWSAMLAVLLMAIGFISLLASMLLRLAADIAALFGPAVEPTIGSIPRPIRHLSAIRDSMTTFGLGALVAVLPIAGALYFYATVVYDSRIVRNVAYFLDFSSMRSYPGLSRSDPMRLLENGYVAYAKRVGWDVKFEVVHDYK
jgi:hypothetical protein